MGRKKSTQQKLLTDLELSLMAILWDIGEGTARDVVDRLPKGKALAYTTVATVMKILEKKGVVASRMSDRAYVYYPVLTREKYEAKSVQHLVGKIFRSPSSLVMRLLNDGDFSKDELESMRALLDERIHDDRKR